MNTNIKVERIQHEQYYHNKVLVLLYHHIVAEKPSEYSVTVSQFREHIIALKSSGYNLISMQEYIDFALDNKPIPANAVVITFDDGYESFYTYAFPVLKELGATASVFIVGISSDVFNPTVIPHLTWEQMRCLKVNGFGIYSHTYNLHHYLTDCKSGERSPALCGPKYLELKERYETNEEYRNRVREDLKLIEKRLREELGDQHKLLAFPYGEYNEQVLGICRDLGIALSFTTDDGINTQKDTKVFRIDTGRSKISANELIAKLKNYC